MPESKPRESQAPSVPAEGAAGSSNGEANDSSEQKRRLFQQWVASVRPKSPTGPGVNVSVPQASRVPTTSLASDHREASPEISMSSSSPPSPSSHPPEGVHATSTPPPSLFPAFAPQRESDSTQLYQKVPADLLRKARESHISSAPPPRAPSATTAGSVPREDPWATADERTAVFAPPPELLASVRAAAVSAGLLPSDAPASEREPASGRITAEFDVASSTQATSSEEPEVTKVAPAPSDAIETPLAMAPRASSISDAEDELEAPPRRRWPWAVAAVLIAAALAGVAMRSHVNEVPNRSRIGAPSR